MVFVTGLIGQQRIEAHLIFPAVEGIRRHCLVGAGLNLKIWSCPATNAYKCGDFVNALVESSGSISIKTWSSDA